MGELSGRQMALKRLEREKGVWKLPLPPSFKITVEKMREILFEFAEGDEQNINQETISAMRIYTCKRMRMESTVS